MVTPKVDMGVVDLGTPDAGPQGCTDDESCPVDQVCTAGSCVAKPTVCNTTEGCGRDDRCVRPLVSTASVAGDCKAPAGACIQDSDCELDQRCTGAGLCGRIAQRLLRTERVSCFSPEDCAPADTLRASSMGALLAICTQDSDCGPGGRCNLGQCAGCTQHDECGSLLCEQGQCREPDRCENDLSCFSGNRCDNNTCTRPVEACTPDASSDRSAPTPLQPAVYEGLSLCGSESDWFSITVDAFATARISVRYEAAQATIVPDVFDLSEAPLLNVGSMLLPGLSVLEIPQSTSPQRLLVRIASPDRPGSYALHFDHQPFGCAQDTLDLYGDESPQRAILVPAFESMTGRLCLNDEDHAQISLSAQDVLQAEALFSGGQSDIDMEALDAQGDPLPTEAENGMSTSASWERLTLAPVSGAQLATLKLSAQRAPSIGQLYTVTASLTPGARGATCAGVPPQGNLGLVSALGSSSRSDRLTGEDLGPIQCTPFASLRTVGQSAAEPRPIAGRIFEIPPDPDERALYATLTATQSFALALLDSCADQEARACAGALRGREIQLRETIPANQTAYLFLASNVPDASYTLQTHLSPRVTERLLNNRCEGAQPLVAPQVVALDSATDEHRFEEAACGQSAGDAAQPERVYTLDVPGPGRTALELRALDSASTGQMWATASSTCALNVQSCVGAVSVTPGSTIGRLILEPSAQPYFIGVESGLGGAYELNTVEGIECADDSECGAMRCIEYACAPVPGNSACNGQTINLGPDGLARIFGSTEGANSEHDLSCIPSLGQADVVYQLTLTRNYRRITARILDAEFDAALAIRTLRCEDTQATDVDCDDDSLGRLLPELSIDQPELGTYYLIVDAFEGSGRFTLELETEP